MAVRSKTWVFGCWLAGIVGSNPAGGDGCLSLVSVAYVVRYRFLRRSDHSSREAEPSVVCLSVVLKPQR